MNAIVGCHPIQLKVPRLDAYAVLALVILSTYPLYFQHANASFAEASVTHEALPEELARWASWHWFRTAIGLVALASALLALRGGKGLL